MPRFSSQLLRGLLAGFAPTLVTLWLTFRLFSDEDDRALWLLLIVAPASLMVGAWRGRKSTDLRFMRHALFALLGSIAAVGVYYGQFPAAGIASGLYRSLLVMPLLSTLSYAAGRALAYVLFGGGDFDATLGFERFVGIRSLRSLRGSVLSVVTVIALVGVVLGVGLMILALGILSGFEGDLIEKIIGAHAHLVVSKHPGYVFERAEVERVAKAAGGVGATHTTPFLSGEVFIVSDSNHTEGLLFGVDPATAPKVFHVFDKVVRGGLEKLPREGKGTAALLPPNVLPEKPRIEVDQEEGDPERRMKPIFPLKGFGEPHKHLPGIIIGNEMARQLHVDLDDTVTLVSPLVEELTPQGPAPKTKAFRVAGVFDLRMYEFDAHYVYIALGEAQTFLEIGEDLSGLAIAFQDPNVSEKLSARLLKDVGGYPFQTMSWQARNKNLFLSLKLEKAVSFIVLIFIILVASFSIVNTLTMAVIEKTREIAILKTMGAKDVSMAKVFVVQGATVGAIGTIVGTLVGIGFALLLSNVGLAIDPDVYYLDRLPIRLHASDIIQVSTLSLILTSLSAIFPAVNAARLSPVDGLRYE